MALDVRLSLALWGISVVFFQLCRPPKDQAPTWVGSATCASCHSSIYQAYLQTPKGRSFYRLKPDSLEDLRHPLVYDPHKDFYYTARWEGDSFYIYEYRLRNRDTVYLRREVAQYGIGSGHGTRSYLLYREGYLYQAPITWYSSAGKWDLSPGYENGHNSRFDREISPSCLYCHSSEFEPTPGSFNHYQKIGTFIGCEKCHGPGSEHVAAAKKGDTSQARRYGFRTFSLVAQNDVCNRCHLEGISVPLSSHEFIPGDTLAHKMAIFLLPREDIQGFGIASHAERLQMSACAQKGGLRCITCHDPHPLRKKPSFDLICQSCHQSCKKHHTDNCHSCHMPKNTTVDIPHVRFTDHWIRVVRPSAPRSETPSLRAATDSQVDSSTVGVAYLLLYQQENTPLFLAKALMLLDEKKHPVEKARALFLAGKTQKAYDILHPYIKKTYSWEPSAHLTYRDNETLSLYGYILGALGKKDQAEKIWKYLFDHLPHEIEAGMQYGYYALQNNPSLENARRIKNLFLSLYHRNPMKPALTYNISLLYYQLGQVDSANFFWQKTQALDPDYKALTR